MIITTDCGVVNIRGLNRAVLFGRGSTGVRGLYEGMPGFRAIARQASMDAACWRPGTVET